MTSNLHSRKHKIGLPPGTPVYLGRDRNQEIKIEVFQYNEKEVTHFNHITPNDFRQYIKNDRITWINIDGIYDQTIVKYVGEQFNLHPLTQEDIMNTDHRPKVEYFEDYLHFTLKMLTYNKADKTILSEQISFVLGKNWVISFQEIHGDIFDPIRDRINNNKGRVRKRGADYLVYALIDVIVDNYFTITDELEDQIEELEQNILEGADKEELEAILKIKKDLVFMRKSVIPVREAISGLIKSDNAFIEKSTRQFLRDVYDHSIYIGESIENYREMLQSLLDIYLTGLSNKLNNVMKTLTVISTVFIPLTFIAGLYGMNFTTIPGADHPYGFVIASVSMILVGIVMVLILRHKKWF
ncbi:MAG TPA: magnesium/cobalt transporter CorA [Flavobacteriales bacterium]|nr:magnesium/cobalt transporter CorA [Flavobacteriales bacterium]